MSVREGTLMRAVSVMAEALRVYSEGNWNHDYPGGIDLWPNDNALEMGQAAKRALRNPAVKRALAAAKDSLLPRPK